MSGRMSEPSGNTGLRPRGTRNREVPRQVRGLLLVIIHFAGAAKGHAVAPCDSSCALKFQLSKAFGGGLIGSCQNILLCQFEACFSGRGNNHFPWSDSGVTSVADMFRGSHLDFPSSLPPARHAPKACRGPSHLVISNCCSAFPFRSLSHDNATQISYGVPPLGP
ncbi:hypothetical protein BC826DRAFT_421855 [Russula brevipes]|nr:hypothetical protein BC826DRAFT_421855 [Russula brevipes]